MQVALFHSMFGRRGVEEDAATRLRQAGCTVVVPDLFDGETVPGDLAAGHALVERIGWPTIIGRARAALSEVPGDAMLIGLSMGVGVIGELWPDRPEAAAVVCLHAPTSVPRGSRPGTPVRLHAGEGDPFAPKEQVAALRRTAEAAGAVATVHRYPGVGHLFTDRTLPDYDERAAAATWADVLALVAELQESRGGRD